MINKQNDAIQTNKNYKMGRNSGDVFLLHNCAVKTLHQKIYWKYLRSWSEPSSLRSSLLFMNGKRRENEKFLFFLRSNVDICVNRKLLRVLF